VTFDLCGNTIEIYLKLLKSGSESPDGVRESCDFTEASTEVVKVTFITSARFQLRAQTH